MTTDNEGKKPINVEELAGKVDVLAKYLLDQEKRRAEEPPLKTGRGDDDDDDGGGRRQRSRRSGGNPLLQIGVISAIVSAVVIMIMSSMGVLPFVSRTDFTKNVQGIIATIDKNKADLSATVEGLRVAVNNIPATVTNQVNTAVNTAMGQTVNQINAQIKALNDQITGVANIQTQTKADTANLVTKVDALTKSTTDLSAKVDGLTTKVTTLQTQATDYETRIKVLEAKQTTATPSPTTRDPLEFNVKTIGNMPMQFTGISDTTPVGVMWQLDITNTTKTTIDQIVMNLQVMSSTLYPSTWAINSPSMTSNSTVWSQVPTGNNQVIMFVSGWGYGVSQLSIPAGQKATLWVNLQLKAATGQGTTGTYILQLQPYVQSYHQ